MFVRRRSLIWLSITCVTVIFISMYSHSKYRYEKTKQYRYLIAGDVRKVKVNFTDTAIRQNAFDQRSTKNSSTINSTYHELSQYQPEGTVVNKPSKRYRLRDVKTISLMPGWSLITGKKGSSEVTCGSRYTCKIYHVKENSFSKFRSAADIILFYGHTMPDYPPSKSKDQLWVFVNGEAQRTLAIPSLEPWDGYFNYTYSYIPNATYPNLFSYRVRRRSEVTKRNFYMEKLEKSGFSKLSPSALWFVSNCVREGNFRVTSARFEYAVDLSQWINITAQTKINKHSCQPLFEIFAPDLLKTQWEGGELRLSDYTFYLSFENSICKDYITEKPWKILVDDSLTIPVVLGGLEIDEYARIAPPNSFIHVKNFTSSENLAKHLQYVVSNEEAFNYYHQWRNDYELYRDGSTIDGFTDMCEICRWAYDRPQSVWNNLSKKVSKQQCLDMTKPADYCKYYNLSKKVVC